MGSVLIEQNDALSVGRAIFSEDTFLSLMKTDVPAKLIVLANEQNQLRAAWEVTHQSFGISDSSRTVLTPVNFPLGVDVGAPSVRQASLKGHPRGRHTASTGLAPTARLPHRPPNVNPAPENLLLCIVSNGSGVRLVRIRRTVFPHFEGHPQLDPFAWRILHTYLDLTRRKWILLSLRLREITCALIIL